MLTLACCLNNVTDDIHWGREAQIAGALPSALMHDISRIVNTLQQRWHSKHWVFSTEASDLLLIAVVARVIKFERPLCFYGVMKKHLAHKVTYQKFCTEFFSTVGCKWVCWGRASGHRAVCVCFHSPAVWLAGSLPSWLVSAGRSDRQTMMTAVIRGCSSLPLIHRRTKKWREEQVQ